MVHEEILKGCWPDQEEILREDNSLWSDFEKFVKLKTFQLEETYSFRFLFFFMYLMLQKSLKNFGDEKIAYHKP